MRLFEVVTGPWALTPDALVQLQQIYLAHLEGDRVDIEALEAKMGRELDNRQATYQVVRGVGVLPVTGVMAQKANLFMRVSGMASTQMLEAQLAQMVKDPEVRGIALPIDSPGGSVFGTPEFAAAIYAASQVKPVIAHTDAVMASASYWAGSGASEIVISGPTVVVGSLGIITRHVDVSKQNEARGMVVTDISSGKYKAITSGNGPLPAAGREYIQAQCDYLYTIFVDTVAKHRGVDAGTVLADMAEGRIFTGQQAIDAGLADSVASLDEVIDRLASAKGPLPRRRRAASPKPSTTSKGTAMAENQATTPQPLTRASLESDHAALFAQLRSDLTAEGHAAGHAAGLIAGATAERERIQAVLAQDPGGHADLVRGLAFDGKTSGPEAAVAVVNAERQARLQAGQQHRSEAPRPVPHATAPTQEEPQSKTRQQMTDEAKAYAKEHNVTFVAACQALGFN